MAIEIIKTNVDTRKAIETCDISNAQVWSNHNGTTLMTVPKSEDEGCYILIVIEKNGVIEHRTTMRTFDLVIHLNRYSFEEINCTIELNF